MVEFNTDDLRQSLPLLTLLAFGLILMLADAFKAYRALPWLTGLGLVLSATLAVPGWVTERALTLHYSGMMTFGGIASLMHIFLCVSALFTLFFVGDFFKRHHKELGEVYALLLFAVVGMVMLANGNDLIMLFVGLEVMSICLYIMAGMFKQDVKSNEAGMKYFLLGAFTTGFLLYGIALIYGITGTTRMDLIQQNYLGTLSSNFLFYPAFGLILIGLLFKIAAFPFHNWTPDVYTGTPTPLTGFMATGTKTAAFVALSNLFTHFLPGENTKVLELVALLALASMLYGNIVAVQQTNLKRMLAYSSIAHTGYILLGIISGPSGYEAMMFYMIIYTLMTVGAFGIISIVENQDSDAELASWKGLGLRRPWLGAAMSAFLFSLAGLPPLAGFIGKYQVFLTALHERWITLAVVGILTSVVGAWYYLRVIVYMYFYAPEGTGDEHASPEAQPDFSGISMHDVGATAVLTTHRVTAPAISTSSARQLGPLVGAFILVALLVLLGLYPSTVLNVLDELYRGTPAPATAGLVP